MKQPQNPALSPAVSTLFQREVRPGNVIHPVSWRDQSSEDHKKTLLLMVLPQGCEILTVRQLHSNERNKCFPCLYIKNKAQRGMGTHNVAGFTVGFLLHGIERLPPQLAAALYAGETIHVEDLVHGCATSALSDNILPAAGTASCRQRERTAVKARPLSQLPGGPSTHPWLVRGMWQLSPQKNNLCYCWQRSSAPGRHSGAGPYEKI